MCTAITLRSESNELFLGRTMDFSYDIAPQFYIIPSSYVWDNCLSDDQFKDLYKFICLAQEMDGIFGVFDGVNEKGFAAAALFNKGYAQYNTQAAHYDAEPVSSVALLHYLLGNCAAVKDLPALLKDVTIVGITDPVTNSVAPLHWIAADKSGACAVIEPTATGPQVINNSIGVLSNSPGFSWQMTNLKNYMEASPQQTEEARWGGTVLTPFGQAGGTSVLPGGFTSPDRFVRTAYLKTHLPKPKNGKDAITAGFHILGNVSIPKGAVESNRDTYDYTRYTALINTSTCEYFFQTYEDMQIRTAGLWNTETA
ncbi:MAG: choloylglycine hydrolase family protein [Lachnospiraceae bacterium]